MPGSVVHLARCSLRPSHVAIWRVDARSCLESLVWPGRRMVNDVVGDGLMSVDIFIFYINDSLPPTGYNFGRSGPRSAEAIYLTHSRGLLLHLFSPPHAELSSPFSFFQTPPEWAHGIAVSCSKHHHCLIGHNCKLLCLPPAIGSDRLEDTGTTMSHKCWNRLMPELEPADGVVAGGGASSPLLDGLNYKETTYGTVFQGPGVKQLVHKFQNVGRATTHSALP